LSESALSAFGGKREKGICTCPVALYPATSDSEKISFNQINRKTGHRIKYAKVDADMLDLAKHIVTQKTGEFEPEKFEDHYEAALAELINAKRNGKTVGAKPDQKARTLWISWTR
jgi:non-homologous end joining protein Ku